MKIKVLFGRKALPKPGDFSGIDPLAVDREDSDIMDVWAEQLKSTGLYDRIELVDVVLDGEALEAMMASPARCMAGQIEGGRSVL